MHPAITRQFHCSYQDAKGFGVRMVAPGLPLARPNATMTMQSCCLTDGILKKVNIPHPKKGKKWKQEAEVNGSDKMPSKRAES